MFFLWKTAIALIVILYLSVSYHAAYAVPKTHNWYPSSINHNVSTANIIDREPGQHKKNYGKQLEPEDFFIDVTTIHDLKNLYHDVEYSLFNIRQNISAVPPVFIKKIPEDWKNIKSIQEKKRLFILTVLPLVVAVNEDIKNDRKRAQDILTRKETEPLSFNDQSWLDKIFLQYKTNDPEILLKRMDIIPTPLAIAQSIEESGWGTSYFARHGNALFGQISSTGMRPKEKPKGPKIKAFENLRESVESYAHNLNTHTAYQGFRDKRAELRAMDRKLNSLILAKQLLNYSIKKNVYVQNIHNIIKKNNLTDFETATLENLSENIEFFVKTNYDTE